MKFTDSMQCSKNFNYKRSQQFHKHCHYKIFSGGKLDVCIRALLLDHIFVLNKLCARIACIISSFLRYGKNTLLVCRHSQCLSIEISLERVSNRSAEPIDLKIGLNMENWEIYF